MNRRTIVYPIVLTSLCSSSVLFAETLTVTASKLPIPLEQTTNSTKIYEREEIAKSGATSLGGFLQQTSGISFSAGNSKNASGSIFIRGHNSASFLLIVDGVKMNDPSKIGKDASLDDLDLGLIEKIELLKGSQAVFYGSDAVSGVIKVTTKSNADQQLSLNVEGGDHRYYKGSVRGAKKLGKHRFDLSSSYAEEQALSSADVDNGDRDPWRRYNLNAGSQLQLLSDLSLNLNYGYHYRHSQIDDSGTADDANRRLRSISQTFSFDLIKEWGEGLAESKLHGEGVNFTRHDNDDQYASHFRGENRSLELQNTFFLGEHHTVSLGGEWRKEEDKSESNTLKKASQNSNAAYLLHQYLSDRFFSTTGLRYEHFQSFGNQLNFKLAPGIHFNEKKTKLFAGYDTNFKAPSLYQLYESAWSAGNDQLQPEEGHTMEVGIAQKWGNMGESQLTAFYGRLRQSIIYGPSYSYINGGEQTTQGIEWDEKWQWQDWQLSSSYTFTDSKDHKEARQLKRPRHMESVKLQKSFTDRFWASVEGQFKSERLDYLSATANHRLGGYSLYHLGAGMNLNQQLSGQIHLTNLTNKKYQEVYSYNTEGRGFVLSLQGNY